MSLVGKKILVTGASGFLGKEVMRLSKKTGGAFYISERSIKMDLRNDRNVQNIFVKVDPDIVIHLAAKVGGIMANMAAPGEFFYDNMKMGMNVIHASMQYNTKIIMVGTVCSYPRECPVPFVEEDLWSGYPEETNAPYGVSKRALLVMCQAYKKQYGLNFTYLIPTNLYGPGDNFNLETSHVIPAMIRKMAEAIKNKSQEITCLGTGMVTRSFLHITDAAKGILMAADLHGYNEPINLPGSDEVKMDDLAAMIAKIIGYTGKIKWDPSKPDGQPRRAINGDRARDLLKWKPEISLQEGLASMVSSFMENRL
jgi:GDP-L-fucose synthase